MLDRTREVVAPRRAPALVVGHLQIDVPRNRLRAGAVLGGHDVGQRERRIVAPGEVAGERRARTGRYHDHAHGCRDGWVPHVGGEHPREQQTKRERCDVEEPLVHERVHDEQQIAVEREGRDVERDAKRDDGPTWRTGNEQGHKPAVNDERRDDNHVVGVQRTPKT